MPVQMWRQRLKAAIAQSERSARAISIEAGMSPGYVHGILNEGKDPTLTSLLALCDVLGVTLPYIVHGYALNHGTEALLKLWTQLSPEAQRAVVADLDRVIQKTPSPPSASPEAAGPRLKALRRSAKTAR
jgi:transcriptional regulator with XRE-family HTH domain